MDALDNFSCITGQEINYHKSAFQFSKGIPNRHKCMLKQIIKMQEMKGIGKYLGTSLFLSKNKTQQFDDLIDRVTSRVEGWITMLLIPTGRIVLINLVTTVKPAYQMALFAILKNHQ